MSQPQYVWMPVSPEHGTGSWRKPLTVVLTVLAGLWLVGVITLAQLVAWFIDEALLETAGRMGGMGWLVVATVAGVLCAAPPLLLAFIPRTAAARAAGRAWALALLAYWVLNLARVMSGALHHDLYLALLALLAGLGAVALTVLRLRTGARLDRSPAATLFALAAGACATIPWLWVGALGGVVETVLAALAAVAIGWLAAEILGAAFWRPFGEGSTGWRVLIAGLVCGVALALVAAAIGGSGVALAQLLALPPLGFAVAALARHAVAATRWLIAVAAFGPLAFVDSDETTLVLGLKEAAFWTLVGAGCALGVSLLLSVAYTLTLGRGMRPSPVIAGAVIAVVTSAAAAVYAAPGQPGWYGDRLFVVLRTQAGLTGLDAVTDRTERIRQTYQRLTTTANSSQAPLRKELKRLHVSYRPYYLVNAIEVDAGDWLLPWLAQRHDVDRVLPSPRLRPIPDAEPPLKGDLPAPTAAPWNITMIGADKAQADQATGSGIVVGNSDSGVDGSHPALHDGFRGGDDSWYDPWNHTRSPTDHNGHGTHTMGTAVGSQNIGVAPGAQWIGCVNLARNLGNPAYYLDCLQFMLAPFPDRADPFTAGRPERAPHVLTNSWGCPAIEGCDLGAMRQATAAFAAAGIFFVAAAGNSRMSGCRTVTDPPAPYSDVLTVGAVDGTGTLTDFSSRGPTRDGVTKPDIFAPGARVLSSLPGGGYGELDGTSMATPHVAGVVALMWSANPKLVGHIAQTREILRNTATAGLPTGPTCGVDVNIVNADAAVRAARAYQ